MKLPFGLDSALQNVSQVKLKGGAIGKICHALIFVVVSIALISWSVCVVWVALTAMILIFGLSCIVFCRVLNLAEKNPQAALMEGAEYLVHEQMMIGTKDTPLIPIYETDLSDSDSTPLALTPEELQQVDQPDIAPSREIEPSTEGKNNG